MAGDGFLDLLRDWPPERKRSPLAGPEEGAIECPNCGQPYPDLLVCPRCGLVQCRACDRRPIYGDYGPASKRCECGVFIPLRTRPRYAREADPSSGNDPELVEAAKDDQRQRETQNAERGTNGCRSKGPNSERM